MSRYCTDYFWKHGIPYALSKTASSPSCYKIVSDPYHKHISIEKYVNENFSCVVYDSSLLDFRQLHPHSQTAWERTFIEESQNFSKAFIRDHNDRLRFIEQCYYKENICTRCEIFSLYGSLLSTHKLFYSSLGDLFDGVELYDSNDHLVMRKYYAAEKEAIFGALIKEEWAF
jgi:hypothetical protein